MKVRVEPETEIQYEIESDYGWLECTYFPDKAVEHFSNLFSHYADHLVEPDHVDNQARFNLYMSHATDLLERFAEQELERALKNLALKVEVQTLIAIEGLEPKQATKEIDRLADSIRKEVKRDLNAPKRGGARRERERTYFRNEEELAKYATTVNSLRHLWKYVTDFFRQGLYDESCKDEIKREPLFQSLSQFCVNVPDKLLRKVSEREYLQDLDEQRKLALSPLGLALEHARLELSIKKYAAETLKRRYNEGRKILKAARAS